MAFCQNCGAEVTGKFCGKCGSATGVDPAAGAPPTGEPAFQSPPQGAYQAPAGAQSAGLTDNVAGALCYLLGLVTGIIFLLIAPYNQNKTIRFHAFQSIFLHLAVIVLSLVIMPTLSVVIGWMVGMLWPLIGLGIIGIWLYMMWTAYQNQRVVLPIIGPIAERQA